MAPDAAAGREAAARAPFWFKGDVGVQYAANVWHHPLVAVGQVSDFLVMDREGGGVNLEEASYEQPFLILEPAN